MYIYIVHILHITCLDYFEIETLKKNSLIVKSSGVKYWSRLLRQCFGPLGLEQCFWHHLSLDPTWNVRKSLQHQWNGPRMLPPLPLWSITDLQSGITEVQNMCCKAPSVTCRLCSLLLLDPFANSTQNWHQKCGLGLSRSVHWSMCTRFTYMKILD